MWRDACRTRTIARLRAELSTLRERDQLERTVVEAALFFRARDADEPSVSGHISVEALTEAVDALLAHRMLKAAEYKYTRAQQKSQESE